MRARALGTYGHAALGGIALALVVATCSLAAQPGGKRQTRRSHPVNAAQSAPDVTGTLPDGSSGKAGPAHHPAPAPVSTSEPEVLTPYYLPDVPRERMRACGETWRARRMAGETGDDDWRDFATRCLADNGPAIKR